jgi:urease accessory protein
MAMANGINTSRAMNAVLDSLTWLPLLLQTTDSAYPIGGFAHSGGLEGMVALDHVRTADDLHAFLRQEVTETLTYVELPLLFQAYQATAEEQPVLGLRQPAAAFVLAACCGTPMAEREHAEQRCAETASADIIPSAYPCAAAGCRSPRWRCHDLLCRLDETSEAIRFAAEQRQASRRLGSQRLALLQKLHFAKLTEARQTFLSDLSQTLPHKHLCIIAGVESALLGTPVAAAMMALAHQSVMMVAQAAMKIMRIGQNSVQAMVADMAPRYADMISQAQRLEFNDLGTCLPRLDIATAYHETAPARMFLS